MKCEGDKTYDKTGKCPKCGMDLTKSKRTNENGSDENLYLPHASGCNERQTSKCSKCGMALKEKETAIVT